VCLLRDPGGDDADAEVEFHELLDGLHAAELDDGVEDDLLLAEVLVHEPPSEALLAVHDEVLPRDLGAGHGACDGPRVKGRGDEDEFVAEEREELEALVGLGPHRDREVGTVFLEDPEGFEGVAGLDADHALGEALLEFAEDGREQRGAERGGGDEPEAADAPFPEALDPGPRGGHFEEDTFGVLQEVFAGLGEQDLLAQPVQKTTTDVVLQCPHGVADGGLGQEEFACGLGETAGAGEDDEGVELPAVEGRLHA
jgi:hypothetical protein